MSFQPNADSEKYYWTIRDGLTQPVLMLGTERALIILNMTLCVVYALSTRMHWPVIFAVVVFLFIHTICVRASKADPRMVTVFRRSQRYRGYYPPTPGIRRQYTRAFSSFPENWWKL